MAQITIIAKNNSIIVNGLQCEKGRLSIAVSEDTILVNNLNGTLSEVTINGNSYDTMQDFIDAADELLFDNGGGNGEGVAGLTWDDTSMMPEAGKIPTFSSQGLLSTGMPLFPENAVPLMYIDLVLQRYLGVFDSESELNTDHPTGTARQYAYVRDVDSTGDILRYYYWSDISEEWMPLNKAEDDVYPNSEVVTNKVWINGKKIYRRVFHNEVIEDDGSVLISLAGVGITEITHFDYTVNENGTLRKNVNTLDISVTNTSLTITPTVAPTVPTSVSIILEYTK